MKDNYYLDIILKGYAESLSAIQLEETFATFESRSTLLNMESTKYSDAEFYQIWINSDPIKTLIERIGKDEFINYEAKSRVKVEAWSKLANFFDSQQKITEREYFITNTEFFKNCLNTIDTLILNLKKIDGNTESIFYYEGVQGSLTDKAGKGFPYCNEINSFIFIRWHIKNTLKNAYKIEQDLLTPQKPQPTETEPLDLSNTSAVEKIIYLNELGIIDFLRTKTEFIGSTNLMATVLSAITDVKASTLQTSLNRLINNDTDDKNHPYKTQKTVERVRQKLIDKNIKPKTS